MGRFPIMTGARRLADLIGAACIFASASVVGAADAGGIGVAMDQVATGEAIVIREVGALRSRGRQVFTLQLAKPVSLDLRVPFDDAPFAGAQLNAQINGRRLLPYFAFGGDTRYDAVKGKPGMHPPVAEVEGRWVIPASFLRAGDNELDVWSTGPADGPTTRPAVGAATRPAVGAATQPAEPAIQISSLTIRQADGGDLPRFANSIYFDFDLWSQGYDWGDDPNRYRYDLALLGILNGKGMAQVVVGNLASSNELDYWLAKRACEDNALGWGYGHQEFYTIWELAGNPKLWAKFVDVDKNPQTQSEFHDQTLYPSAVASDPAAKGADVVLYDVEKLKATLGPPIRILAPYTDFYNFKREQHGPWGQGFGDDGERWAAQGVHGDTWARNYYEAMHALHELVQKNNPGARVEEMNHWFPSIRRVLFDTAVSRGQPMADMIDALTTHFATLIPFDLDKDGRVVPGEILEKQYRGGRFVPNRGSWPEHYVEKGFRPLDDTGYPETAIDFNRYRLGRTETDTTASAKTVWVPCWSNGQPFDYRAGFRGDEAMYNSENGVNIGYSAIAPYQFIHGFFSYGLLPTGASEPRDLHITARLSLTKTADLPVNLYGEWVDGAGHMKRLRTRDPLYGDMFGWTGEEHRNAGDYIKMVGIKDAHHRLPGADAYGLVRRTCYAFVTTGPVVPAVINNDDSAEMVIKCLVQTFDHKRYVGLYAANFDGKPHALDVTLPLPLVKEVEAMVFDERASDWKSAQPLKIKAGSEFRYQATVPPLSAWLVLIPLADQPKLLAKMLDLPAAPEPLEPAPDGAADDAHPRLAWQGSGSRSSRYIVEVSREALFRPEDRIERSEPIREAAYAMQTAPPEHSRRFWRVCEVDGAGRRGEWSEVRPFLYHWPAYSAALKAAAKGSGVKESDAAPVWRRIAAEHKLETVHNLAQEGEIFATGGRMRSPSRAVDGQAFSWWSSATNEEQTRFPLPAEWSVIWTKPIAFHRVTVLWYEGGLPKTFKLQRSDDADTWMDLLSSDQPPEGITTVDLKEEARAKFFRVLMPQSTNASGEVGIRELVIE